MMLTFPHLSGGPLITGTYNNLYGIEDNRQVYRIDKNDAAERELVGTVDNFGYSGSEIRASARHKNKAYGVQTFASYGKLVSINIENISMSTLSDRIGLTGTDFQSMFSDGENLYIIRRSTGAVTTLYRMDSIEDLTYTELVDLSTTDSIRASTYYIGAVYLVTNTDEVKTVSLTSPYTVSDHGTLTGVTGFVTGMANVNGVVYAATSHGRVYTVDFSDNTLTQIGNPAGDDLHRYDALFAGE